MGTLDAAAGHWPRLLMELGGLAPDQLTDRHQSCPSCAAQGIALGHGRNVDRYRWDRDDGPGGWFCSQCGGKDGRGGAGSGLDLLMRVRRWSLQDACSAVERHLGIDTPRPSAPAPARSSKRPHRIPSKPPAGTPPPPLGRAVAQWCYRDANGQQLFWVQRIERDNGRKLFVHRTWLDDAWHYPSKRDGFASEWPAPRPVYRLPDLISRHDAPVLVVEGEKTADAAVVMFPDHVVIAWCGGTGGIRHADWSVLAGRAVTLWPDNDNKGRDAMAWLAATILPIAVSVEAVKFDQSDQPDGWDLADARWKPARAAAVLAKLAKHVTAPPILEPELPAAPPAEPSRESAPPGGGAPFSCLGFDDGSYYYQPGNTGQVIRIGGGSHTSTQLLRLAPLAYWETIYPGKTGPNWSAAVSSLFVQQAAIGIYSPDRIRGRGAWWDDGRSVLHLGDRLLVDGALHPITAQPPSRFNYQRLASIDLPTDIEPLSDQQGAEILDIASRFLWEVPASGLLMAGWAALAPICGSLAWRPHIWLTAGHGSGKTSLLDRFLGTLLHDRALWPEGSTTEASIRQELRADALPVIMDEAESNEQSDRKRIQDILALARVASSSGRGFVGRGGADGAAQRFTVRAMFLLCSISTALKQGADASRFAQLTLRNPSFLPQEQRAQHWAALDRDMTATITTEIGHQMLLRSVHLIPVIRDSVAVFRRAAANRFDSQRQGDQYGTLLAGAWSLMNGRLATEADAYQLIDSNDWDAYREAAEQPDEDRCLAHILQHQLRVEGDRGNGYMRTVWELVELSRGVATSMEIGQSAAEAHLGRVGIRVEGDRILVSNSAKALQRILADTAWQHSWSTVLGRLAGAQKAGVTRFRGLAGVSRAVSIPVPTVT